MLLKLLSIYLALISANAFPSWEKAEEKYQKNSGDTRKVILELTKSKYYYSALAPMKEFLVQGTRGLDGDIEESLYQMIQVVGVKQFETLPFKYLMRSKSDSIKYILAKKYMREKEYSKALRYLENINPTHGLYPFAKNMEGVIQSVNNNFSNAVTAFKQCRESSREKVNGNMNLRRLELNSDYCTAGIARTYFAEKKYGKSNLSYLDIEKSSRVWPEILFEEAWNSYYLGNYNRTLGKLVSYKAPLFQQYFNPERDVLSALSYLKLCLFQDAKKITNDFYTQYLRETKKLRRFLKSNRKNFKNYYAAMMRFESLGKANTALLKRLYLNIQKEEVFHDMRRQLSFALKEFKIIKEKRDSRFKKIMLSNIAISLRAQRSIMGSYIRSKLISNYAQLYKSFEGMSYIKLEILAKKKARLYSPGTNSAKRGDVKYIKRNDKQYFWNFNGEFWADELGDYVFALKSEC